ncbi:hypothetical protein RhiirA4_542090 [Rhizophagus irregularis]|uniref:Uncharacterized protein n=1 Tax=Rhizophagus irregularis TaxID=588596 RepID=A0A2I1GDP2_9GLOM|nr:hypothetical protein RhiirA4_542090 [Rhizophagus irregularis]
MSDNDIETGFFVYLRTLNILDTKKVLPFIMTDEIYQGCLPLIAGILDISGHLLEENRNYKFVYEYDVNKSVPVLIRLGGVEQLRVHVGGVSEVNNPDKMIFALVGNEEVDQLTKLNQALEFFWIME